MPVEDEANRGASNDWRCLLGTFPGTLGEVAFFLFLQGGGGGGGVPGWNSAVSFASWTMPLPPLWLSGA